MKKILVKLTPRFIRKIYKIDENLNIMIKSLPFILKIENIEKLFSLLTSNSEKLKINNEQKSIQEYINMQKISYEDINRTPESIVGNYQWHENYPYETFLLYEFGDIRYPIFDNFKDKIALDFACGPGRMVKRMRKLFNKVDGCDISQRLLNEAAKLNPESDFYLTKGNDLGNVKNNFYDFVYCTISMQHIACHSIRISIIKNIYDSIKIGGKVTLQMAYNPDVPYVKESKIIINDKLVVVKDKINIANYMDDDTFADGTNGKHDVGIGLNDIELLKNDFISIFGNCYIWFSNTKYYYANLKNAQHGINYWATDWIYIHCVKMV